MKRGHRSVLRSISRALAPRILLVACSAIAPLTLSTLAFASPPDPSWVQGIYDDADHDDVVVFLTSETAEVRVAPTQGPPAHLAAEGVAPPTERVGLVLVVSASRSRAPPAS